MTQFLNNTGEFCRFKTLFISTAFLVEMRLHLISSHECVSPAISAHSSRMETITIYGCFRPLVNKLRKRLDRKKTIDAHFSTMDSVLSKNNTKSVKRAVVEQVESPIVILE
jgi:hypothetical protein